MGVVDMDTRKDFPARVNSARAKGLKYFPVICNFADKKRARGSLSGLKSENSGD